MNKQLFLLCLTAALVFTCSVGTTHAQGLKDVKINEILVNNNESYADDHANHTSWVELHNSGYSNINIGGAYLTVKRGDQTRTYRIPKNDARTLLAPQGYVIFFADSSSNRGTFHTNFTLHETGYLALMDQGRNVVDSVVYDVSTQQADISIGRIIDLSTKEETFGTLPGITPMQANEIEEQIPAYEVFRLRDPSGIVMAMTAMSVVFSALIVLYLCFKTIGKNMVRATLRKEQKTVQAMPADLKPAMKPDQDIIGEEIAAIAIALRRYEEDMHDIEYHVLTINRVARAYSPWSSKIYGLNNQPNRK